MGLPSSLAGVACLLVLLGYFTSTLPINDADRYYDSDIYKIQPLTAANESLFDNAAGATLLAIPNILITLINGVITIWGGIIGALGIFGNALMPQEFSIVTAILMITIIFGAVKLLWPKGGS